MAEHWIPAAKAYELIRSALTLCARLHAGLVKARADLLVVSQEREKREDRNAPIPKEFWWAEGHEALCQNWERGDFSTWIDQKIHLQGFGVSFALGGILEMLPLERRAIVARELSVASKKDWVPAARVHEMALASGIEPGQVTLAIIREATLGFLSARAVMAVCTTNGANPEVWQEREWDLTPWFWSWLPDNGELSWSEGYVRAQGYFEKRFRKISTTGVYFLKEAVESVFPQPATTEASPVKSVGGRPPAEFTDDLWAAICGQIYRGDVHPDKRADLARAMMDWAVQNGHEISETTAKTKARKLFAELQKKA